MEQQVYLSTEDSLSTLGAREASAVMVVWRELPEADISAETWTMWGYTLYKRQEECFKKTDHQAGQHREQETEEGRGAGKVEENVHLTLHVNTPLVAQW